MSARSKRSVDEEVLDRVRDYSATEAYKKAYRKRSVWVEPLFAEGKQWHGMRRFRLRELWRVNSEAFMRVAKISNACSKNEDGVGGLAQQMPFLPSFWLLLGGFFVLF
jgi:Transposase DDE domain